MWSSGRRQQTANLQGYSSRGFESLHWLDMKLFFIFLFVFCCQFLHSQSCYNFNNKHWDWGHYQKNWPFYLSQAFVGGFSAVEKITISDVQYNKSIFPKRNDYFGRYVGPRDKTWVNGYHWYVDDSGNYIVDVNSPRFLKFSFLYFTKDINHGAEFGRNLAWQASVITYNKPCNGWQMVLDVFIAAGVRAVAFQTTTYFLTDPAYR